MVNTVFEKCEELLKNLPGGEMTARQQSEELERLKKELVTKKKLVEKYKKLDIFSEDLTQPQSNGLGKAGPFNQSAPMEH